MQTRESAINQRVDLTLGIVDSLTISSIFTLFLKDVFRKMLEETARFILFPLSGAIAVIRAALAIRQASIDKGQNGTVTRAVIEVAAAAAISTAVVGGFVAASIFATIAPLIFTATLAAKTLFHTGSAVYYWGQSVLAAKRNETDNATHYRNVARTHAVGATALTLATVAIAGVMLLGKTILAVVGLVSGAIATASSVHTLFTTRIPPNGGYAGVPTKDDTDRENNENAATPPKSTNSNRRNSNAQLHNDLGSSPAADRVDALTETHTSSLWKKPAPTCNATNEHRSDQSQPAAERLSSLQPS
jgi:hypothetical protein